MKKQIVLSCFLVAILPFAAIASVPYDVRYPALDPMEKISPKGHFLVTTKVGGEWKELGSLGYDMFFREKRLAIHVPENISGEILLRLVQKGGGYAQIDAVFLDSEAPVRASGGDGHLSLNKISKKDFDVIDASRRSIECLFRAHPGETILSLTARVDAEVIPKTPFQFPLANLYKEITTDSAFYTYAPGHEKEKIEVNRSLHGVIQDEAPFFKEFSQSGSGHPSSYTYGWVWNDDQNLYVSIDFTGDNTMDGGEDYAKVYVNTGERDGLKAFVVSTLETQWGKASFTYSDKVPYEHKYYQFKIPFTEMGLERLEEGGKLLLAFEAYGTDRPEPKPVPTLSWVGVVVLALLFGGAALWMRKRKK